MPVVLLQLVEQGHLNHAHLMAIHHAFIESRKLCIHKPEVDENKALAEAIDAAAKHHVVTVQEGKHGKPTCYSLSHFYQEQLKRYAARHHRGRIA